MDLELYLIVIYIRCWNTIDSLQWIVESTLELDFEGASTLMGPISPRFELIYQMTWFMRVGLTSGSSLCIRSFW